MALPSVTVAAVPLALSSADAATWLDDHLTIFGGVGGLIAFALVVAVALRMPYDRRSQLIAPIFLLSAFLLLTLLRHLAAGDPGLFSFLTGCALFCILAGLGSTGFVLACVLFLDRLRNPLPAIGRDLIRLSIYTTALLVVLFRAGVDAGALFTGSAVITAVIGFSLRDTLGNLIAGLTLQLQPPFKVGDWIQFDLKAPVVGQVIEINWRSTKVLTLDRIEYNLPNGVLAQAPLANYSRPERSFRQSFYFVAPFEVEPDRVRRSLAEALRDVPGVSAEPPAHVLIHAFTDRGTEYRVLVQFQDFMGRVRVEGAVRERIWYALARAGIPFAPARCDITLSAPPVGRAQVWHDLLAERLAAVPIFAVLPREALLRLAALSREQAFAQGEPVLRQGDPGSSLYLAECGEVVVTARNGSEPPVEIARLGPGSVFGEMSLLTGESRSATVVALTACRLVMVDKSALEPILRAQPEFAERMSQVLLIRQAQLRAHLADHTSAPDHEGKQTLLRQIRTFFGV